MIISRNIIAARVLGVLAIASVPGILWFGWWHLVVSLALGMVAFRMTPIRAFPPAEGPLRGRIRGIQRRLNPHAWRGPIR
jgi:hypothetical protein